MAGLARIVGEQLTVPRWGMTSIGFRILMRTPGFRRTYLLRGLIVWFAIRAGYTLLGPSSFSLLQVGFVVLAAVGAVLIDARRRNEDLFLANLGVARTTIGLAAATLPVLFEGLFAALLVMRP